MAAESGAVTLSVGLKSGVRLWLARVMHSSKVLMKVAQVALSREACRGNVHKCCWTSFKDPNVTYYLGGTLPPQWEWLLCQQCTVFGWFGPAGLGGRSTDGVQTSLSSDHQDLHIHADLFQLMDSSVRVMILWTPIKSWLAIFGILKIRVHLSVSNHVNSIQAVYPCVCDRPVFQLWKNPRPPTTSVSLQRSQLGRKSAARRGWSAPDALGRLGGL